MLNSMHELIVHVQMHVVVHAILVQNTHEQIVLPRRALLGEHQQTAERNEPVEHLLFHALADQKKTQVMPKQQPVEVSAIIHRAAYVEHEQHFVQPQQNVNQISLPFQRLFSQNPNHDKPWSFTLVDFDFLKMGRNKLNSVRPIFIKEK